MFLNGLRNSPTGAGTGPHPSKLTAAGLRGIFTGKESFSQAIARQSNGSAAGIALAEHVQRVE
jgi:hypothetical protein